MSNRVFLQKKKTLLDSGRCRKEPGDPTSLTWGKKIAKGRKAGRASKKNKLPRSLAQDLDPPLLEQITGL